MSMYMADIGICGWGVCFIGFSAEAQEDQGEGNQGAKCRVSWVYFITVPIRQHDTTFHIKLLVSQKDGVSANQSA